MLQPVAASPAQLRQLAYQDPERYPVLLDSAAAGRHGRYTILAAHPREVVWQDDSGLLHEDPAVAPSHASGGFLAALDQRWRRERDLPSSSALLPGLPFRGGWIVFLGYEIAAEIEPQLRLAQLPRREPRGPAAFALRVACGLVYDHEQQQCWAFAEACEAHRLPALAEAAMALPRAPMPAPFAVELAEEEPECFRRRIDVALDHIRAGDIYQANLSRPWRGRLTGGGEACQATPALYERLRRANPAPFAALVQFQDWRLLSSSPERLVRVAGSRIDTRPIAGTRPRSRVVDRHAGEIAALIAHPKERAEHVMLIDLERNDLGRICQAGSVCVDEFMAIESYAHVHHIVSNVSGELLPHVGPVDVLRAVFPGGTISGCPKFRCMQIIAELEAEARQAYTGSLGFINLDGSLDFNILIRTLVMRGQELELRTGAGIVADSERDHELEETRAKARGVLAALEGSATSDGTSP